MGFDWDLDGIFWDLMGVCNIEWDWNWISMGCTEDFFMDIQLRFNGNNDITNQQFMATVPCRKRTMVGIKMACRFLKQTFITPKMGFIG